MVLPSIELGATFGGWLTLNVGLNYYNKYVLSATHFHYPFLLSMCNKLVGLFVAVVIMAFSKGLPNPSDLFGEFKRPLVHVQGIATALNIGLNNWSLVFITLTLNQVLKATGPLPTAVLSMVFEGKSFSWQIYGSMLLLVVGCVLAAWGSMGDEPLVGILICIGSVLAAAAWTVFSAVLMQSGAKPLDAVSLLFVSGPTCILTLAIFFVFLELPMLRDFDAAENEVPPLQLMLLFLSGSAGIASLYDIVHNHFVKITSSMNMAIMGNAKLALLIVLSMATLERSPTLMRLTGVGVAVFAVVWYSVFKLWEAAPPKAGEAATGATTGEKREPLVDSAEKGKATKATEATEATRLVSRR